MGAAAESWGNGDWALRRDLVHSAGAHWAPWARSRCGVLLQPLFTRGHAEVPPQQHYEWCLYEFTMPAGESGRPGTGWEACVAVELTDPSHSCDSGRRL